MRNATLMLFVISFSAALSAQTNWKAAFQGSNGHLWVVNNSYYTSGGTAGATDTGLGMMAGTSPSITGLPVSGWEVAVQANTGTLWIWGPDSGADDIGFPMMAGTSPSIAGLTGGGWELAYQASNGGLYVFNYLGSVANTGLAMTAGSSPSVAGLSIDGYVAAVSCPEGTYNGICLVINGHIYNPNPGIGIPIGSTSPSVIGLANDGYVVAINTGVFVLWESDGIGGGYTTLAMKAGTSPSITALQ
jgi:hypothetical protein